MTVALSAEAPPIRQDSSGALRVGDSRVLLELVIHAFQDGATPESIAQRYDTLVLGDIYAVIGYYLRHPAEIDAYLARRDRAADDTRRHIESRQDDLTHIRQRLAARRDLQG